MKTSEKYYIDKTKTWRKSIIVFKKEGVYSIPMLYISKPKHVKQKDFEDFINKMQIVIEND